MPVDPEYLRRYYASLSDEGLQAIDRADLVEAAKQCYDYELRQRGRSPATPPLAAPDRVEFQDDAPEADDPPAWLEDASEVFSRADFAGSTPAPDLVDARNALEAAGIACYLDLSEAAEEASVSRRPTHVWRLMVPGDLNLRATSVLERDIFNADFEAEWKTHLQMLSDEELRAMNPRAVFCGLFDRVERVTRSYDEEIVRRNGFKTGSS